MGNNQNLDPSIMLDLQTMLGVHNPYVPLYKQAYQIMADKPANERANVQARITLREGTDHRRYNLPTVQEVAAIIPGSGEEDVQKHREIILRLQGGALHRISHLNPLYSPLHYALLFPKGDQGWHTNIPWMPGLNNKTLSGGVTQRCYYSYRLHTRENEPTAIFRAGRLFQQYIVDAFASIEESELFWVRTHQEDIRADLYQTVWDGLQNDPDLDMGQIGTKIILPASHLGSPRHMFQLFQDSMAICRYCRKPDLFVTMTANPNWPEVQEALLKLDPDPDPRVKRRKQTAADRPDIVARVFHEKKQALLKEIEDGLFGDVIGSVHTIEFQKRGLPHMLLLIFLKPDQKIHNAAQTDSIVSAQIPDPEAHPLLYETVTTCMMHGPCGPEHPNAPCIVDGQCSKRYPKTFRNETNFGEDGYPEYARPDNGRTYTNRNRHTFDNRSVVPYNPYLSAKYNCHINVEICASVKAIKYIHKYIYKGPDKATVEVGDQDEIKEFIDARYIGPVEACWRIMQFPMHGESPSVRRLPVHLKDKHDLYWKRGDDPASVINPETAGKTPLTEWFKANQDYPDLASQYTYQDFPQAFVWETGKNIRRWKIRQRGFQIGRMPFVHPSVGERFYLRMLLTIVNGAKDWKDLQTFNGIEYPTYKAACLARGILEDDGEWDQCLQEAGEMQTGNQLRRLFAILLLNCFPVGPEVLWECHKANICDDLRAKLIAQNHPDPPDDMVYDYGLHLINKILKESGKGLEDFPPMPLPQQHWEWIEDNFLMQDQLDYNPYLFSLEV